MIAAISPVKLIIGSRCYFVFSEVTEEVVSLLEVGYAAAAPPQPVLYRSSGSLNSLLAGPGSWVVVEVLFSLMCRTEILPAAHRQLR